jgi:hypothetical protein
MAFHQAPPPPRRRSGEERLGSGEGSAKLVDGAPGVACLVNQS